MTLTPEQKELLTAYAKAAGEPEDDFFKKVAKMDDKERAGMFKALQSFAAKNKAAVDEKAAAEAKVEKLEKAEADRLVEIEKAEKKANAEEFEKSELTGPALKAFEKMEADNKAALERIEKAEESVKTFEKSERKRVWTEKAAELKAAPGEDNGDLLAEVAELSPEIAERVHEQMKAADAAVAEGDLYREKGSNRAAEKTTAEDKVTALAKARFEKSEGSMTLDEAEAVIWGENPELYAQHESEQSAR